jgi:hypothetical protein
MLPYKVEGALHAADVGTGLLLLVAAAITLTVAAA